MFMLSLGTCFSSFCYHFVCVGARYVINYVLMVLFK